MTANGLGRRVDARTRTGDPHLRVTERCPARSPSGAERPLSIRIAWAPYDTQRHGRTAWCSHEIGSPAMKKRRRGLRASCAKGHRTGEQRRSEMCVDIHHRKQLLGPNVIIELLVQSSSPDDPMSDTQIIAVGSSPSVEPQLERLRLPLSVSYRSFSRLRISSPLARSGSSASTAFRSCMP
jgi:hypothetical protein